MPKRIYDTYRKFGRKTPLGFDGEEKNLKIIALFCDPSTRVFSDFLQSYSATGENQAWTVEEKKYVKDKYVKYEKWGDMFIPPMRGLKPQVAKGFINYVKTGIDFLNNMKANNEIKFSEFITQMNDHNLDHQLNYTGKKERERSNYKY